MTLCAPSWWWGYRTAHTRTHARTQAGDMKVYTADWLFWHWAEGRFGWLASPQPPPLSPLRPHLYPFTQHSEILAARPVTAVERQPVLSVLSALAFSWLGEMPVSILHQYPFIAITVVLSWLADSQRWEQQSHTPTTCFANLWLSLHAAAWKGRSSRKPTHASASFVTDRHCFFLNIWAEAAWQTSRWFPINCGALYRFLSSKLWKMIMIRSSPAWVGSLESRQK